VTKKMDYSTASFETIPEAFYAIAAKMPEALVYSQAAAEQDKLLSRNPRKWLPATYKDVSQRVNKIAAYLQSIGVSKDTKVAILCATRPEWMEADLAILASGGVSVSVYHTFPPQVIAYILYDSGAQIVFAENQEQIDKLLHVASTPCAIPGHEDRAATTAQITLRRIIAIEPVHKHPLVVQLSWVTKGTNVLPPTAVAALSRNDLACLVYTSGTTGPPKGVMQTHGNYLANIRQGCGCGLVSDNSVVCLFLPLAHSFAKLIAYIGFLTPIRLCFPAISSRISSALDKDSLAKDIRESNAGIFPVVPRMMEKIQDKVCELANKPGAAGKVLTLTLWAARQLRTARLAEQAAPVALLCYWATWPIRRKIKRGSFGSSFEVCICGAAKLGQDTAEFFEMLGIEVVEGYGLTETCVANSISRIENKKLGSVGPPLAADVEIRLAPDCEILVRGPHLAKGYYHRPTATAQAWDNEGWFHTGDLGVIDEQENLTITGRKKEIIITSGGKNIPTFDIEKRLSASPLVSNSVLVGEGKPYCVALICLDLERARAWAAKHGITGSNNLHANEVLQKEIWRHVEECNKHLSNFESVKKILIVPETLSIENGLLTPTYKVKRSSIVEKYADQIEQLYKSS
jgi:long-chain acyl-CoA synthetase